MSQINIEPFSQRALERIAKIIGDRYTGWEITRFFERAGFPEYRHDGTTKWWFVYHVLQEIQGKDGGIVQINKIIEQLCDPQEFFGNSEGHGQTIHAVNEVLSFYGLKVDDTNYKLVASREIVADLQSRESEEARLFDSRAFHPEIRKHGRLLFLEGRHFHSVFECCKAFDKYVREKSKLDKHGNDLMGAALSLKNGPLKLNAQQTETERNEQDGLMYLCKGLMSAIRNPESHEPELDWRITREDALDILSLINFLYRQIDKTVFTPSP